MRTSLVLSVLLHIVVLSAVLFNFSTSTTLDANHQPVAVELISPSDLTQVKAGKKDAPKEEAAQSAPPPAEKEPEQPAPKAPEPKPVDKVAEKQAVAPPPPPKQETAKAEPPKPEPAKPEPAKAEPKPEPEKKVAAAKPEPLPEPKREEGVKPEPKPEPKKAEPKPKKPEPKPEPKQEAKAEPKPEQEKTPFRDRIADLLKHPAEEQKPQPQQPAPPVQTKREFDPDRIQALLNRDPRAGAPATQEGPKEPWRKPSSLEEQAAGLSQPAPAQPRETYGAPSGQDARMSASEIDYFRSQISRCWTPPVGGLGAEDIVVKLRIELNKDGTLVRPPQIANGGSSAFFTAAADSAMRAVFQCQPYTMPADKYGQWRDMLLNFDPRRMYGG